MTHNTTTPTEAHTSLNNALQHRRHASRCAALVCSVSGGYDLAYRTSTEPSSRPLRHAKDRQPAGRVLWPAADGQRSPEPQSRARRGCCCTLTRSRSTRPSSAGPADWALLDVAGSGTGLINCATK
ncbi:hypothetical protein [Mycobacterium marinum]|uniref:hypothetical protein n=1 Tax=Mycobacterium marinum TaxID=1781 RepID=UPI000A701239